MVSGRLLSVGDVLSARYAIVRPLKEGGMSQVYLANDQKFSNRVCVIKVLDPRLADPDGIQQFRQEADVLASLDHPYIVKVSDRFSERGNWCLVMELVDGLNLEEILEKSPQKHIQERQVLQWAIVLCRVLTYIHSQKPPIIFRDLKPANIMVNSQSVLKLIDFGIARFFNPATTRMRTGDTMALGTEGYSPPEQYSTSTLQTGPYSDVYSLGATIHHLVTGRDPRNFPPFNFPPARTIVPGISARTEEVIVKSLSLKIPDRYQTADEMRVELQDALTRLGKIPCPVCKHSNPANLIYCTRCANELRSQYMSCAADRTHSIPVSSSYCRICSHKQA